MIHDGTANKSFLHLVSGKMNLDYQTSSWLSLSSPLLSVQFSWLQFFYVETSNFIDKCNHFWYRYPSDLKTFNEIILSNNKFCSFYLNTDNLL